MATAVRLFDTIPVNRILQILTDTIKKQGMVRVTILPYLPY
jgi:hypothetical protein